MNPDLAPKIIAVRLQQIVDHWIANGYKGGGSPYTLKTPQILNTIYGLGLEGGNGVNENPFKEHGFAVTLFADILDDMKVGKNTGITSPFSLNSQGSLTVSDLPDVSGYDAWIEVRTNKEVTLQGDWWKAQATTLRLRKADGTWLAPIVDPDTTGILPVIPLTGPGTYLP